MYCINCGVQLAEHEVKCPICGTPVYDPNFIKPEAPVPYPRQAEPRPEMNRSGVLFVLSFLFLIPIFLTGVCDLVLNGAITWSGYPMGALLLGYLIIVLPLWFPAPNPVIFVPADFAGVLCYLLYIDLAVKGNWFLPFVFPVVGALGLIVCAVVALCRYVPGGTLYIFGGASIALGATAVMAELLMNLTFHTHNALIWSIYPLVVFALLGLMLIVIAICKPLQESLKKKFFL